MQALGNSQVMSERSQPPQEPAPVAPSDDPYETMVAELEASGKPFIKLIGPDGGAQYIQSGDADTVQMGSIHIESGEQFRMETSGNVQVGTLVVGQEPGPFEPTASPPGAASGLGTGTLVLLTLIVLGFVSYLARLTLRRPERPNP